MKKLSVAARIVCAACAVIMAASASACSSNNHEEKPEAKYLTEKGYQMPYEYDDDYVAYMKTIPDSEYETISTTNAGGKVVHLTTDLSETEVKQYYEDYFKGLKEVKAKLETDDSVGYYDEENRIVVFNLVIWTADGKTNYKMGCSKCEDIYNDETWELK